MTAFKMVPVMDMNEVTYHMLEVTHSHLALSKHMASVSTCISINIRFHMTINHVSIQWHFSLEMHLNCWINYCMVFKHVPLNAILL